MSLEEQIMSKDKYATMHIFAQNRGYCVQIFCNASGNFFYEKPTVFYVGCFLLSVL